LVGLTTIFWDTAWSAVKTWHASDTFGHGFFILPVVAFLIWRRRAALARLAPRSNFWGLVPLALFALTWLIGDLTGTLSVQQFALVGMYQALFFVVLGTQATAVIAFALVYLYFAVSFGSFLIPPLQEFTAIFLVRSLQTIGIPVYMDGMTLQIPSGSFLVAEACSGVRYLISTMALGFLAANLMYRDLWRRALFIGLAIVVPVIANGFRAVGIVLLAHISDYKLAVGADHLIYGLIFLSLVTALLLALGLTFRERDHKAQTPATATLATATPVPSGQASTMVAAGLAVLVVAGAGRAYGTHAEQRFVSNASPEIPAIIAREQWRPVTNKETWQPLIPAADAQRLQTYAKDEQQVALFLAYYVYQRQGAEVVNQQNDFVDATNWTLVKRGHRDVNVDGLPVRVAVLRIRSDQTARLVWYWYWVDGRFTASPYVAKAREAMAKLLGRENAAAVIAISSEYTDDPAVAERNLQDFLAQVVTLQHALESAVVSKDPGTGERDGATPRTLFQGES
jgi:exosortase A